MNPIKAMVYALLGVLAVSTGPQSPVARPKLRHVRAVVRVDGGSRLSVAL